MDRTVLRICVQLQNLSTAAKDESGQDMVEYALVIGLIAMGAVAAMNGFATTIGNGLTSIGAKLTGFTS